MNILTSISSFFKYPFQNQSNNVSHLQSQPHDIIELIISKLSFNDQLNMRQVSTEMKNRFHAIPTARRAFLNKQPHLQPLPHDIIELIISKLSFNDQLNMRQVSSEMKSRFHATPNARSTYNRRLFYHNFTEASCANYKWIAHPLALALVQLLEEERFPGIDRKEILRVSRHLLDSKNWRKIGGTDWMDATDFLFKSAFEIYDRIKQQ